MRTSETIFLDTCIFDAQNYNFESREFSLLKEHFPKQSLVLLLPDPTEREINRHLQTRANEAEKALRTAQIKAPFVRKLAGWPSIGKKEGEIQSELFQHALNDLNEFLTFYTTKKLGYQGVDVVNVMNSYDEMRPPFGEGAKRKEFPDAFVVEILDYYFATTKKNVTVISKDSDLEKACHSRPHLKYFSSLGAYVAATKQENESISKCIDLLAEDDSKLISSLSKSFEWLGFVLEEDWEADFSEIKADKIEFDEVNIIEASGRECTATYAADVTFSAEVSYDDYDTAIWDHEDHVAIPLHRIDTSITETAHITGAVSILLSEDLATIEAVKDVMIDQDTIEISIHDPWS